jgi:CHAD domain-containing protein
MAYRLKLKEPLVKGVRRIASEQLANAAARLQSDADTETSVHEARKCLKRTRALLRLVRPGLGEARFRELNQRLRDVARALSAARDRDVVRRLLTQIADGKPSQARAAQRFLAALDATSTAAPEPAQAGRDIAEAAREIEAVQRGLDDIGLDPPGIDTIVAGLTKCHRSGRKALERALEHPEDEEALHDLRKSAQAYWRQMILMQHAWPEACLARAGAAKVVADLLGQDHDVALLESVLAGPEASALSRSDHGVLSRACKARHGELRSIALPKAQLLFIEKSESLGERMRELWEASRRAAKSSAASSSDDVAATERKTS